MKSLFSEFIILLVFYLSLIVQMDFKVIKLNINSYKQTNIPTYIHTLYIYARIGGH